MEVKLHSPHPFCTLKYDVQELVHYITLQLLTLTSCPLPLLCATSRSNCPWALLLGPLSRDKTCFYITVHQIILYSNCIALPLHYTAIVLYCVIISPCHGHGPLSRDKTQVIVFHSIFVGWDFLKRGKICPCPCIYQNGPLVIWIDFRLVVSFLNPNHITQTSQELRMLSRSLSYCRSLLLNLNLNRCLSSDCSDCSDCSAIVVLL